MWYSDPNLWAVLAIGFSVLLIPAGILDIKAAKAKKKDKA